MKRRLSALLLSIAVVLGGSTTAANLEPPQSPPAQSIVAGDCPGDFDWC